jgi:hypothetical protein
MWVVCARIVYYGKVGQLTVAVGLHYVGLVNMDVLDGPPTSHIYKLGT